MKAAACLLFSVAVSCLAQQSEHPGQPQLPREPNLLTRQLHSDSSARLSVPGFASFGWGQCDGDGNLYFRVGQELNKTAILRLAPDGKDQSLYTLTSEYADDTAYLQFRVSREGDVQVLAQHRDGSFLVFSFQRDSTTPVSHVRLDTPHHVALSKFAVLPDGVIVAEGRYDSEAPPEVRGTSYFAEFDPSGKLRKQLSSEISQAEVAEEKRKFEASPNVDESGRLYLVDGDKIKVLSEAGKVERTLLITKPSPDYVISRIQPQEGRVGIWFDKLSLITLYSFASALWMP